MREAVLRKNVAPRFLDTPIIMLRSSQAIIHDATRRKPAIRPQQSSTDAFGNLCHFVEFYCAAQAEFEAIAAHLPEDLQDFARWGYFTGWRKGEISSLRWNELNMESRQLRLRRQFSKNGEQRTVPLMGDLWEIIQRRWKARRYRGTNGEMMLSPLVFFRKKGRGVPKCGVPVTEFRKTWKAASDEAGKPDALFHDFRRTAVRNMIRAGVPRKIAMLLSGHKTESVFERYNISDDHDLEDAVRKTQAYVDRLAKEREEVAQIDTADDEMERSK
jgi:integrase